MTAAMIFVLVFVFIVVALTDYYRWRNCKKAPLTETMRKLAFVVRVSLNEEARAEFEKVMHAASFKYAVKKYLKR